MNAKVDKGEKLMGQMIHTTPPTEAAHASGLSVSMSQLTTSHGCVHIPPAEMSNLFANKAKLIGSLFVVYEEELGGNALGEFVASRLAH